MVLPPSLQGSLPAGWLAFTGRELNPLDRIEGFQITSSSLPGLFLAQRPKTLYGALEVKQRIHGMLFFPQLRRVEEPVGLGRLHDPRPVASDNN
jgi:hypothetical protein